MSTIAPASSISDLSDLEGGQPRRWTREEYYRAADLGLFRQEERLELIGGELIEKLTQKPLHARGVLKTAHTLGIAFGPEYTIRQQMPIVVAADGEPEPDICVVHGLPDDFSDHPTQNDALLVVEISDTTLRFDLGRKAAYYAEAGIADYWVLDLTNRRLHAHRNPISDPQARFGFRYQAITEILAGGSITPLALPNVAVSVQDMLPL